MTDWPTEEWIQEACLNDCTIKYSSYEEWWNNHSSGISRLVRKLFIEDYIGRQISWEEYDKHEHDQRLKDFVEICMVVNSTTRPLSKKA